MPDLMLRAYKPADLPALVALDTACFESAFRFSRGTMRRFAEAANAIVRLAVTAGTDEVPERLLGFCIVHLERRATAQVEGYVVTLDVASACRGQGIGHALMQAVEALAQDAGAVEVRLHVSAQNAAAIRLYERLGYRRERQVNGFYGAGGDALIYRRPLGPIPGSEGDQDRERRTSAGGIRSAS